MVVIQAMRGLSVGLEILERQDWQKNLINSIQVQLVSRCVFSIIETMVCIIVTERDCGLELLNTSMTCDQGAFKILLLLNEHIPTLCFLIFCR